MSTILITGCSTGFGRRTAEALARRGHTVFATMRDVSGANRAHADRLEETAKQNGWTLRVAELDVRDPHQTRRVIETAAGEAGGLDVVINNAGVWGPGVLEAFTLEQWRHIFDVNVFGSLHVFRAALPRMRSKGEGLIVQMSSLQGRFVLPYSGPYVASKFAVEGMAETFRAEVAPFGVEVTIVEPFDYMTEMKQKARSLIAADADTSAAYGVEAFLEQAYLTPDAMRARNPQEVVDALCGLVESPRGTRPVRLTVGNPLSEIEDINRLSDQMHRTLYPQIGLAALAPR